VSVLLYASMATEAQDEQVDVRQPVTWSSKGPASVILRPVPLVQLAELVDPDRAGSLAAERRRWAEELVALRVHKPSRKGQGGEVRAA
jgi:hypothetical protein